LKPWLGVASVFGALAVVAAILTRDDDDDMATVRNVQ
jgi:hypothetical protein